MNRFQIKQVTSWVNYTPYMVHVVHTSVCNSSLYGEVNGVDEESDTSESRVGFCQMLSCYCNYVIHH